MVSAHSYKPPFTGTGFTGSKTGNLIPEYEILGGVSPKNGAKLYEVNGDVKKLVAEYNVNLKKWVKV